MEKTECIIGLDSLFAVRHINPLSSPGILIHLNWASTTVLTVSTNSQTLTWLFCFFVHFTSPEYKLYQCVTTALKIDPEAQQVSFMYLWNKWIVFQSFKSLGVKETISLSEIPTKVELGQGVK